MKLKLAFENGEWLMSCRAETEEEKKMLGVLGQNAVAAVETKFAGHYSHQAIEYIGVTLSRAKPTVAELEAILADDSDGKYGRGCV